MHDTLIFSVAGGFTVAIALYILSPDIRAWRRYVSGPLLVAGIFALIKACA